MSVSVPDRRRGGRPPTPPPQRFRAKVDVRGPHECWPWTGGVTGAGTGSFRIDKTRTISAHGYAKFLATGVECPPDKQPQHRCKTSISVLCCNPTHIVYAPPGIYSDPPRGENSPAAKLTNAQVREIIARRRAGERPTDLAAEYGINRAYVRQLVAGCRRAPHHLA